MRRRLTWPDEHQTRSAGRASEGILDAATGERVATWWGGNLLHDAPGVGADGPPLIVAWSGHPDRDAANFFARDPRAWLAPAAHAFDAACDRLRPLLESSGRTLVLRPHARHVLCDPTRCASFLDAREGQPFGIMLDIHSMLEEGINARDFAQRAADTLANRAAMTLPCDHAEPGVLQAPSAGALIVG